jgi:pimeloyl-ACP methyl ester carboxylesterase
VSAADAVRGLKGGEAASLYLRAAAICRIARFPAINSLLRESIWSIQKLTYAAATESTKDPTQLIFITHRYAAVGDGFLIPLSYKQPSQTTQPVPVIVCISGHDGSRIDFTVRSMDYFTAKGWAIIGIEMPGCGDCPASKTDATSPDRLWDSLLDWIQAQPELDEHNVCIWGLSTGAYYSLRAAHTHSHRLRGAVAQGLWAHIALSPEWIDIMDSGEYPTSLTRSLMHKFGFDNIGEMKQNAQKKFSLVESGILHKPCTRLLLLNGMDDTVYPIEDSMLVLQYGGPKEARFIPSKGHLGEPEAGRIGFAWTKRLFTSPRYHLQGASELNQQALRLHVQQDSIWRREGKHGLAGKRAQIPGVPSSATSGSRQSSAENASSAVESSGDTPEKPLSVRKSRRTSTSSTNLPKDPVIKAEQKDVKIWAPLQCQNIAEQVVENSQKPGTPIQDNVQPMLPTLVDTQLLISQKATVFKAKNANVIDIRVLKTAVTSQKPGDLHQGDAKSSPTSVIHPPADQGGGKAGHDLSPQFTFPGVETTDRDPDIGGERSTSVTSIDTSRSASGDAESKIPVRKALVKTTSPSEHGDSGHIGSIQADACKIDA